MGSTISTKTLPLTEIHVGQATNPVHEELVHMHAHFRPVLEHQIGSTLLAQYLTNVVELAQRK